MPKILRGPEPPVAFGVSGANTPNLDQEHRISLKFAHCTASEIFWSHMACQLVWNVIDEN